MINQFGAKLDRNGYAPSIMQLPGQFGEVCFLCGEDPHPGPAGKLDRHEIFGGPFRKKSKALGLWVLVHDRPCHLERIHMDAAVALRLKKSGQRAAMRAYGWTVEDFRREFGKNYLDQEDADA